MEDKNVQLTEREEGNKTKKFPIHPSLPEEIHTKGLACVAASTVNGDGVSIEWRSNGSESLEKAGRQKVPDFRGSNEALEFRYPPRC